MIEQAADVGMMQGLCGGSVAIRRSDIRVGHERLNERLQVRILKAGNIFGEGLPELVNVLRGLREIVAVVNFSIAQFSQLVDGQLETVFVFIDQTLDLEEVVLF